MALQADLVLNASGYNTTLLKAGKDTAKVLGDAGTKGGKALEKGLSGAKSAARGIGSALNAIAPGLGDSVRTVGKLAGGLKAGASAGGAFGVAIGAGVLGLGLLAGGWLKVVDLAARYSKELAPLQAKGLLPMAGEQSRAAADGLKAITVVGKQAVVMLGDELAPSVTRVTRDIVALGLYGEAALGGVSGAVETAAVWLGSKLVKSFLGPVSMLQKIAQGASLVARMTGVSGMADSLDAMSKSYDDFTKSIAQGGLEYLGVELSNAEMQGGKWLAKADKLMGAMDTFGNKTGKATEKVDLFARTFADLNALSAQLDPVIASAEALGATWDEIEGQWTKSTESIVALTAASRDSILTSDQRQIASLRAKGLEVEQYAQKYGESQLTMAARLALSDEAAMISATKNKELRDTQMSGLQSFMSQVEQLTASSKNPVMKGISKVFVAGQILLNSFLGASKLWATGNPLAMGLGAGIVATGSALAVQAALTPDEPAYDVGSPRVPQTAHALVHKDEIITPAPVARRYSESERRAITTGNFGGNSTLEVDRRVLAATSNRASRASTRQASVVAAIARGGISLTGRAGSSNGY